MAHAEARSSLLTLVFTDLAASTALKTELGDRPAAELLGRHQAHVRRLIGDSSGREVDQAGDGFFLTFHAPSAAVAFALRLQQIHSSEPDLLPVRVGIHLGEITERPAPPGASKPALVEGLAVDLAARIQSLALPGQVLMSAPVFDAARQRLKGEELERDAAWRAHGPYRFQGIEDPVAIGEAGFEGISPLTAPPDSPKARRVVSPDEEPTLGWRPAVGLEIPGRPRWKLEAQLGTGAIGEVWLAAHEKSQAKRVYKFCLHAERLRSLRRELALLRLLREQLGQRDDIAQVIDWELERAPYFLETEYSEAGDLVEWADQQGGIEEVPLESRLEIVAQVAEALGAAHGAGVLHRDLKPANILVSGDAGGRAKARLTDFGIGLVTSREALSARDITFAGLTQTLLANSSSTGAGTRLYMAPELLEGKPAAPASDIYSLGVVLYQIVAGDLARALAPGWERDVGDELLRADIAACIDREPKRRLKQPVELAERLRDLGERHGLQRAQRRRRGVTVGVSLAALLAVVGLLGGWAYQRGAKVRWARQEALPQIERLVGASWRDFTAAYELAVEAEKYLPDDPELAELLSRSSLRISIKTDPPGASVYMKEYAEPDTEWMYLGVSPLENTRVPIGIFRWMFTKEGYETVLAAASTWDIGLGGRDLLIPNDLVRTLDAEGSIPPGMVRVPGAQTPHGEVGDFLIDRYEVTNQQFKEFVDAGGYENRGYWKHEFVKDGRVLTWEEALAHFVDQTGRPGPATWRAGDYPDGQADYPVSGVSWYEAAAYAAFLGRALPTEQHWGLARGEYTSLIRFPQQGGFAIFAPFSNFAGTGPVPVGRLPGISSYGAYDMAGNVREWCWNETAEGRLLRGGAWDDNTYRFTELSQAPAFDRSPRYGFRTALYLEAESIPRSVFGRAESFTEVRDYYAEEPVSDDVFEVYKEQFSYDQTDLNARVEAVEDSSRGWTHERITLDAAYGDERLIAHLFLPKDALPPYQTVVYFPGSGSVFEPSSDDLENYYEFPVFLSFLVKNGRAVLYPVYKGTFERRDDSLTPIYLGDKSHRYTDYLVQIVKDFRRSIDYLRTRGDIDTEKLAYYGMSWGGILGALIPAVEHRIKASVLLAGSFMGVGRPEADELNYVTRVTVPTLMLNGRYDSLVLGDTSTRAMFELLGTPDQDKVLKLYESDHIPPRDEIIRETLAWLDRYLGPVHKGKRQAPRSSS